MRKFLLSLALAVISASSAMAASNPIAVIQIKNVQAFTAAGTDWSLSPQVQLSGYYTKQDGGEGTFVLTDTPCVPDGGSCLADGAGNTYIRTNFNGHIEQYGITSGSIYDASAHITSMTDSVGVLRSAMAAGLAQGIVNFTTDGVSVFWASSFVPPANTSLSCGATSVSQTSSGYYVGLPGTVYLAHGASYAPTNDHDGIGLHWCVFDSQWYADSSKVSQFSGMSFASPPLTYADGEAMRANMPLAGDTALKLTQVKGAQIDHIGCFGFDVCYSFVQSDHMNLSYFWGDGDVCMYGENGGGQSDSDHIDCEPFLNKQPNAFGATCAPTSFSGDNSAGICNEIYYSVTGMAAAGTTNSFGEVECSVTVGLANWNSGAHKTTGWPGTLLHSSTTLPNGDAASYAVFMANFNPIVAGGHANALGCDASNKPIVVTASSSTSATFTIKGSSYSTGGTQMQMVATWAAGPSVAGVSTTQCAAGCGLLKIVSGNISNLRPGMIVSDNGSSGIQAGTTVVAIVPNAKGPDRFDGYIGEVFVSLPPTIAATDGTVKFDGGTFTSEGTCDGHTQLTCAFFNSDERIVTGDSYVGKLVQALPPSRGAHAAACYFSNGVAGWRQLNAFCYSHGYWWIFGNSNNALTTDAHNDGNGETDRHDVVGTYNFGSSDYVSVKGNGYTKGSETIINDQWNLNESSPNAMTTSGTVSAAVESSISIVGSTAGWATDGGTGTVTGKLTVAMCQTLGTDTDCRNQLDLQYITLELTGANSAKVLACGQFFSSCQAYVNGAQIIPTNVTSANASASFTSITANTTDVSENVVEVLHGAPALTDVQNKGVNRFAYVSGNAGQMSWNGFNAQVTDVLYENQNAIYALSGCGNYFAGTNQAGTPPTLSQLGSMKWQCSVDGTIAGAFTPTGASTPTTLANFGDRSLSILDFGAVPDCTTNATTALTNAETAALAQGVHVIRLDGTAEGSCYAIGTHTVPSGIKLWCPGPPATQPTNNDYRNFPNSISLTSNGGLTLSANSWVDCPLIRSTIQVAPPTTSQGNYARAAAYTGTAVTFNGDGSGVSSSMVVGFATCFLQGAGRTFWIQPAQTDCNQRDKLLKTNAGGMIFDAGGVQAPFGTRAGTGGPVNQINIPFATAADNGAGALRIHLPTPCNTANCALTGEKIWLINTTPYQSAQGGWVATVVDTSDYDLQGSDSGFLAGKAFTGVTVTAGSNEITGLSLTSINQVQPTQLIAGACIPAAAQIMFRESYYGIVWMMNASGNPLNATCSSAPTETITITDQATGVTSITADAVAAAGSGYVLGDHLRPTDGTVVTDDDADLVVSAIDGSTGVVTADIADGGSYTVCPPDGSGVTDLTTPAATGATFHFACTGAVALYANNRTGAALQLQNVNAVRISNLNVLSSEICAELDKGSNDVDIEGVACHDQNALQDQTHHSIVFNGSDASNGTVGQNKFCSGGLYYFGGILDLSQSSSSTSSNVICHNTIVGPKGAGLQKTMLDVASPGGAKKNSITLIGNSGIVNGLFFIPDDLRSAQFLANDFPSSYLLGQSSSTYALLSGSGNNFIAGSMPISPKGTTQNSIAATVGGGQAAATRVTANYVRVNSVASDGAGIMLRPGAAGFDQTLTNASTNTMQVYGSIDTADTINAITSATGVPQAPGTTVRYSSVVAGAVLATVIGTSGTNVLCPVSRPCVYSALQTVNLNTGAAPAPSASAGIQTVSNDAGNGATIEGDAYAAAMAFKGVRRDGTNASPTAVQSGETVNSVSSWSYDGVSVPANSEAYIRGVAAENQSATNHGHDETLGCTPIGSSGTAQECSRFNSLFSQLEALKFYGSAPAVTGTGSPTIALGSTDNAGEVTGGTSATSIIITFNVGKTNAPFCVVSPQTSVASFVYAISTTAITITETAQTGQHVNYMCVQH